MWRIRSATVIVGQRPRPARQRNGKVGPRPVQHQHEIVADGVDAAGAEIAQRLSEIAVERLQVAAAIFDVVMYRHALDDAPAQAERAVALDLGLALPDRLDGPDLAIGNVVQGGHDAGGTGLPRMLQRRGIARAEPSPGLFHRVLPCADS